MMFERTYYSTIQGKVIDTIVIIVVIVLLV